MSYTLPALPYASDVLEPFIDSRTMEIHHGKHHAAYVNNLNNALKDHPELADLPVNELIANLNKVPEAIRTAVRNNGGGHSNHTFFWDLMTPGESNVPVETLAEAINKNFETFEEFKAKFEAAGVARFGSGWVWLVINKSGALEIVSTPNQDSPIMDGLKPVIGNDVWEHAYYLHYQNRRPDYLKAWWSVVNWEKAEGHFRS
ncbi:MAG: superoxide dismutase [Verrucomicrobia bacterium RIFCSPHIGHO2_12_FULL_41_10]|nr:MAG: superoxide dismutase [Verrucomicrobia bacterium RIFCSPHIGHO2_12_FULL_41_10]HLB33068.1 superoxide dismutase [Chthoniobacterales bacterium]